MPGGEERGEERERWMSASEWAARIRFPGVAPLQVWPLWAWLRGSSQASLIRAHSGSFALIRAQLGSATSQSIDDRRERRSSSTEPVVASGSVEGESAQSSRPPMGAIAHWALQREHVAVGSSVEPGGHLRDGELKVGIRRNQKPPEAIRSNLEGAHETESSKLASPRVSHGSMPRLQRAARYGSDVLPQKGSPEQRSRPLPSLRT